MTIYVFYLFLVGAQTWYGTRRGYLNSKKGKLLFISICCAELTVLAALRGYTVGADTKVYLDALEYYAGLPKKEIMSAKLLSLIHISEPTRP